MDKWTEWEEKEIKISQDDLSRLLMGIEILSKGARLTSEQKYNWRMLLNRLSQLVEPEPSLLNENEISHWINDLGLKE